MLLDAAIAVMVRDGYADMTVADVLAECGLSTRSFYRHFASKDALLTALVRREVGSVTRRLERAVTVAADPAAAVDAWLDGFLDTFFEPTRARRGSAFTTADVLASSPLADGMVQIRAELAGPLAAALRAGHEAGVLVAPQPELDAGCIFGLVTAVVQTPGGTRTRAAAREQVLRYVDPALGINRAG